MSSREKAEKRLDRKEKAYETKRLMRNKRSEDYQVIEEVFDRSTLINPAIAAVDRMDNNDIVFIHAARKEVFIEGYLNFNRLVKFQALGGQLENDTD